MTLEYQKQPSGDKTAPTFAIAHEVCFLDPINDQQLILSQMGHVFGMDHEQTRPDRECKAQTLKSLRN